MHVAIGFLSPEKLEKYDGAETLFRDKQRKGTGPRLFVYTTNLTRMRLYLLFFVCHRKHLL